ncbi:type II toxin-antitoxin system RelE/ParE family toxin [Leptospira inadai]|uniref:Plasmid maintenance system killer protein n=1 Tax=Leptospira inadai serovar Lyme TaxID=293084 RepID=A0ABX4YI70_9LEPT|nr:type II toxin-antitoxin system RelE/ParE family toxin [Leptospira inadai]PNV74960.1 plasmid maintenance system killer protein [Leptospira inadai serovar Lyme]
MILSFADKETKIVWDGNFSKKIKLSPALFETARRKLRIIAAAPSLDALKIPPSNHLEQLKGDRKGQWSIRINSRYRVCFNWSDGNASEVEIVDYH